MLVRIKLLDASMGHLSLAAITPSIVKEYRDYRLESVGPNTVRKDMTMFNRVMKVAQAEWGINMPRGNPCNDIQRPSQGKPRERRLQDGEETKLLEAARAYGGDIEHIIIMAIETGMCNPPIINIS